MTTSTLAKVWGANVAAWKQAARGELAASTSIPAGYCHALLDSVKAFDKVTRWLLIREGVELGYPLWLLRLSMSVYRMKRVIRVATTVSRELLPRCGITAGSGFACAEMKVVMIRMVDRARHLYRTIVSTLFVDDLAAEHTGPHAQIQSDMGGFIECMVEAIETNGMQLNRTKSVCYCINRRPWSSYGETMGWDILLTLPSKS